MTSPLLPGKTAIVTGGAAGFGAGIARHLAAHGARVVIADLDVAAARTLAVEIGGVACEADVASAESVDGMVTTALAELGHLDILVNNAGTGHAARPMEAIDEAEFDRVFAVNARSVYLTARAVIPHFKTRRSGVVLNIGSTAAVSPRPNTSWYSASKGWVVTATRAMAIELAPFGIRANALNPTAGDTQLLRSIIGTDGALREAYLKTIPLGRFVTPDDMGSAAAFLCSEQASMITGVALEVDGGRCL